MGVDSPVSFNYGIFFGRKSPLDYLDIEKNEDYEGEWEDRDYYDDSRLLYAAAYPKYHDGETTDDWKTLSDFGDELGLNIEFVDAGDYQFSLCVVGVGGSLNPLGGEFYVSCGKGFNEADMDAKLKAFCEKMGIPYEEPEWFMMGEIN